MARPLPIIAALVVLSIAATLWWLFHGPVATGEDGTTVQEVASCSEELPWEKPPQVERVSHESSALLVRILANASCGPLQAEQPSAAIEGNTVTLSWQWVAPKDAALAACLCTRRLEFRIPKAQSISSPVIVISEGAR